MKLFTVTTVLGFATPALLTKTYPLWYDVSYNQMDGSLSNVACSTGEHGLMIRGYSTFSVLPTFPAIGGIPQIQSWNSPNCGTCWELGYTFPSGYSTSVTFTAINTAPNGAFTISLESMNALTVGNAEALDGVEVTVTQLAASKCGL